MVSGLSRDASRAIFSAAESLASATDEERLLLDLCRNAILAGHHKFAWYGRVEKDGSFLIRPVAHAGEATEYLTGLHVTWDDSETGRGPGGTAVRTGQLATVHDNLGRTNGKGAPDFTPWKTRAAEFGFRSNTAIPVFVDGQIDGVLAVYSSKPGVFDDVADSIHTALARQAGVGLQRLRGARQLTEALEDTIGALSAMIDSRDPFTAGHQLAVSGISATIAAVLGLSDHEARGISIAALVHDIGKVAIPIDLLLKPASLRPEERKLLQTHTERGQDVLRGIHFPWPVAQIVGQHHERLDGSGYPAGLDGNDILLATRIVMVADVFDAMRADRPYRRALSMETTMEYLEGGSGSKFDAEVVRALRAVATEFAQAV